MGGTAKKTTITKMLSPEEMALLGTMQSTLNELLSLQNGNTNEQAMTEGSEGIMETLKKLAAQSSLGDSSEEMGDETITKEDEIEKEDNGRTANESAEQRSNPTTDINDKNISEVGKMLKSLMLVSKNQSKMNTQKNINNSTSDVINTINKALTPLVKKVESIEQFNTNLLEALGFSEKIEKSQSFQDIKKSQNNMPVQNIDATAVVNELVNVIKTMSQNQVAKSEFRNDWNGAQQTRKNLESALPYIFQNALQKQKV